MMIEFDLDISRFVNVVGDRGVIRSLAIGTGDQADQGVVLVDHGRGFVIWNVNLDGLMLDGHYFTHDDITLAFARFTERAVQLYDS